MTDGTMREELHESRQSDGHILSGHTEERPSLAQVHWSSTREWMQLKMKSKLGWIIFLIIIIIIFKSIH